MQSINGFLAGLFCHFLFGDIKANDDNADDLSGQITLGMKANQIVSVFPVDVLDQSFDACRLACQSLTHVRLGLWKQISLRGVGHPAANKFTAGNAKHFFPVFIDKRVPEIPVNAGDRSWNCVGDDS